MTNPSAGASGMNSDAYDPTFFDRVMTQSPMPIWEEGSEPAAEMEMEPDQEPGPGQQYTRAYLVGPGSGAGMGAGPVPGIGIGIGFGERLGSADEILDPDGVPIGSLGEDDRDSYDGEGQGMFTEPNSPDKFGEGISLPLPASLPER